MKLYILFFIFLLSLLLNKVWGQEIVVDPVTSAAIFVNAGVIGSAMSKTNDNLSLINKGQLAVTGQLLIVNDLQNKIYKGLSQVASVLNNLASIKDIATCGIDIVNDVEKAVTLAKTDPVLLLFAEQGARDFETRAITLGAEVSAFVLQAGCKNLMDSGERGKLLNHINSEMRILRGIAYGMQRAMYWAKMRGVFNSLNPWATWQNMDVKIANDVISHAKYLKR